MKMKTANIYIIQTVLHSLVGSADINSVSDKYLTVNGDDENEVKAIISEELLPAFKSSTDRFQNSVKQSLWYYLSKANYDFEGFYDSCLIALPPPKSTRDFFIWLWEVLFPETVFDTTLYDNVVEKLDPMEPYLLLKK